MSIQYGTRNSKNYVITYDTYDPQPKYSKLAKPLHITTAKGSGFRGIIKSSLLQNPETVELNKHNKIHYVNNLLTK